MPTYEYECTKCKKRFDAFQSMKDEAYKTCPKDKCQMKTWGKGKVKRLIGAVFISNPLEKRTSLANKVDRRPSTNAKDLGSLEFKVARSWDSCSNNFLVKAMPS